MYDEEIVKYLLKECGGLHPYYIIHILALLDMEYIRKTGKKLTELDYVKEEYGFYSNKLPELLEKLGVEKVHDENGSYLVLRDENVEISLPQEIVERINAILDEFCELTDGEMHRMVMDSPEYSKL
jgi:hypothetical protein